MFRVIENQLPLRGSSLIILKTICKGRHAVAQQNDSK